MNEINEQNNQNQIEIDILNPIAIAINEIHEQNNK